MTTPDPPQMLTAPPPEKLRAVSTPPPEKLRAVSTEVHNAAFITSVLGLQTGERSPKSLLLEKPKDPFILPHFGSEIGDGESISLPTEQPELAEIDLELFEAAFEKQPAGDGLQTREQLYANLDKKRKQKQIGDGESIWVPPQSPEVGEIEAPELSEAAIAAFKKQAEEKFNALYEKRKNQIGDRGIESVSRPRKPPELQASEARLFEKQLVHVGDGLFQRREDIYAIFESKRKPFPRDEEWINRHYCCLKNPKLIDNPDVTEIQEEDLKWSRSRIKAYTRLPRFRENLPFCEKLKTWAIKLVESFNSLNDENLCYHSIEVVAAAPIRCYRLDIKVSKGDAGALRRLRGTVCDGEVERVLDAGGLEGGCCENC